MLRNFPLYVSRYRLRGLVAEISSLNAYRRALQSVGTALKEQALKLEQSLDVYNARLEELLLESLDQVEGSHTTGEPELKRSHASAQFLSALCYGTMLRIEEQKISEADDHSTAFHSALQLMEACSLEKDQQYFSLPIFKKTTKFEELRSNYFSNEVLVCDMEQKPRILCGQLSEHLLNNPELGFLLSDDIEVLSQHADKQILEDPPTANPSSSQDNQDVMLSLDLESSKVPTMVESFHQLNTDVSQILKLCNNDLTNQSNPNNEKSDVPLSSSAVEQTITLSAETSIENERSQIIAKSEELKYLLERSHLSSLKQLSEYLDEVKEKIILTLGGVTDAKTNINPTNDNDDIDEKSSKDFLDEISSYLASKPTPAMCLSQILACMQSFGDPQIPMDSALTIEDITDIIQRVHKLENQKTKLDKLISTMNTLVPKISSTPAQSLETPEGIEYIEVFRSAVNDFQDLMLYLGSMRDVIQGTMDGLQKNLTDRLLHFVANLSKLDASPNRNTETVIESSHSRLKELNNEVENLQKLLKELPYQVECWDSQARTRINAYDKEHTRLHGGNTIAKYANLILNHRQNSTQLFEDIHREVDGILSAELTYSHQAYELYLEQLKLTATIKALPCSDISKETLGSLMNHKRCKKCKTFDWTMCRMEDGFLYCENCVQNETGRWYKVIIS